MAWKPQIVQTQAPSWGSYEAEFLASEFFTVKRIGITIDASTVSADSDGNKPLPKGCTMAVITASGKYAPYNNALNDGREVAKGFLMESVNLRHGDAVAGLVITGSVIADRCSGLDSAAQTDLAGTFTFQ